MGERDEEQDNTAGVEQPVDVLLVEDNPGDVRLVREAFADVPHETTLRVARDGVDALECLSQRTEQEDGALPDIVLDLNLPRKSGTRVLEEVREDPELSRLPVVVFSGSDDPSDIARSYELQANAYLTKPVSPGEFTETIRRLEAFWHSTAPPPQAQGT